MNKFLLEESVHITIDSAVPAVSVVIPVYKAEDCLQELYSRLKIALSEVSNNHEIIFIEDDGKDQSWDIIKQFASNDHKVKGIQFSRNFGQHYGITAGLDYSLGDWVVVMDCDLQDRPEEIPALYKKAVNEDFDIVLALRGKRSDPIIKRFSSKIFYKLFSYLADINYSGDSGNFRIMSRKVVKNFCKIREQLRFFGGIVQWLGFNVGAIEVEHSPRYHGKSTYTYIKLWALAIDTIIAYSDKPLRIAIRIGFMMAFLSFSYGCFIIAHSLIYGSQVKGWNSLIVSLFFIGGVIIFILGILGIYLGKVFDEIKSRPLYIINNTIGFSSPLNKERTNI